MLKKRSCCVLLIVLLATSILFTACSKTDSGDEGQNEGDKKETVSITQSGLPVYSGSQQSNEFSTLAMLVGFSSQFAEYHSYVVSDASPQDIANWYKEQLNDYEVKNEGTATVQGMEYSMLHLQKGNELVGIVAMRQKEKTVYFIGKVTNIGEESGEGLPADDVSSGEEPIGRYPGSVMLSYYKTGEFPIDYDIEYGSNDDWKVVSNWYKKTLQSQGWNLTGQSVGSDTIELEFKKGDDDLKVFVAKPGAGTAYTTISVAYTMKEIPDHDLVSGTDPIERYPAAIMAGYNHKSLSMGSLNVEEIKAEYISCDSLEKVHNWYKQKLSEMFPGGYIVDDGSVIEVGTQTSMIRVEFINHETYTDIIIELTKTKTN